MSGTRARRMTPEQALEWVVRLYQVDLPSASQTEQARWIREFNEFTTVLIDGWHEQPPRFSWKHGGSGPEPPTTLVDHLNPFQHDVEQALQRATTPMGFHHFPTKSGASESYQLYCNPEEDDYPTTVYRPDAALYLLKALLRWNRSHNRLRECPEWREEQRHAKRKCRRFFLYENRSDEKYCQDACANRASQRRKRKGD